MGALSFACEGNLLSPSAIQEEAIGKPVTQRKRQQSQVFVTVDGLVMERKRKCKPTASAEMVLREHLISGSFSCGRDTEVCNASGGGFPPLLNH